MFLMTINEGTAIIMPSTPASEPPKIISKIIATGGIFILFPAKCGITICDCMISMAIKKAENNKKVLSEASAANVAPMI